MFKCFGTIRYINLRMYLNRPTIPFSAWSFFNTVHITRDMSWCQCNCKWPASVKFLYFFTIFSHGTESLPDVFCLFVICWSFSLKIHPSISQLEYTPELRTSVEPDIRRNKHTCIKCVRVTSKVRKKLPQMWQFADLRFADPIFICDLRIFNLRTQLWTEKTSANPQKHIFSHTQSTMWKLSPNISDQLCLIVINMRICDWQTGTKLKFAYLQFAD